MSVRTISKVVDVSFFIVWLASMSMVLFLAVAGFISGVKDPVFYALAMVASAFATRPIYFYARERKRELDRVIQHQRSLLNVMERKSNVLCTKKDFQNCVEDIQSRTTVSARVKLIVDFGATEYIYEEGKGVRVSGDTEETK